MLNYTSTSVPLKTELTLITELYILLILFDTYGHRQLSFIVTVKAKGIHPVQCNHALRSVMVMKEILIMSGFKAITVRKPCLCPALS